MNVKTISTDNVLGSEVAQYGRAMAKVGFAQTPIFSLLKQTSPVGDGLSAKDGIIWEYEYEPTGSSDNKHIEGSDISTSDTATASEGANHYQISKDTAVITRSASARKDRYGDDKRRKQIAYKEKKVRLDIDSSLISANAPIQRVGIDGDVGAVAGQAGGLQHFCGVHNTVDASTASVSMDALRDLFQKTHAMGEKMTHLVVGYTQKNMIDKILFPTQNSNPYGATTLEGTNILQIKNMPYAENVKIVLHPGLDDDKIIGLKSVDLELCIWDMIKPTEVATSKDQTIDELIIEWTLKMKNPYNVCLLDNLATA
jgi:hypothetical protein